MAEAETPDLTTLTVQLLSAYVSNNLVPSAELAGLIQSTRTALSGDVAAVEPAVPEFAPATTARKSLASRDHILSMIDGKPYKTLKRHLSTNGLTPAEYRDRYKLPKDYPMVAPSYSEQRREVAKRLGLGRKPAAPAVVVSESEEAPAPVETAQKAPTVRKARVAKAKSAVPAKDVGLKAGRKPKKSAAAVPAASAAETNEAIVKPTRDRKAKTKSAPQDVAAEPATKPRRGRKAAVEAVSEAS
ncbi:MucR family transcriptional regulator [Sphingomonas sp. AR_OL41]|uniref:MucR family transcriptional regulator n=1 Tax=Facivitalis istanbulensis TaxID=3075838 RepID=UPI002481037D|nr:MucR family transcriptional regulator [Sphingomonas sp. AR_OL41]MDH7970688.1 MucR family transcriptional regulator [Sphingomonas sp. AR_OL41]